MNEKNNKKWLVVIVVIVVSLIAFSGVYALQKRNTKSASSIQIYESYDCDKLRVKNIEVPKGETPINTALKYLPGPGGISTVAKYAKSFKVEGDIAYIDWPTTMNDLPNIDTSCALQAFLQPIDKTLTKIDPIDTVIHSIGGNVEAFYMRMGLSCPEESAECDYDAVATIPIDKNFKITNIGNSSTAVATVLSVYAYGCDTYGTKDGVPLYYSKIDFFISKNEKNVPAIFLGTTPSGSAGSGECDLLANENSLKYSLEPGEYRIWAVRYIDNKPDRRTPDVLITIRKSVVLYHGAWFDIEYPKEFSPSPTTPTDVNNGITRVRTNEARFTSLNKTVEFFVFSPLWAGDPADYLAIGVNEEVVIDKSDESGSGLDKKIIRRVTIKAKDGSYYRSFESTKEQVDTGSDLHHVFGIKYQNNEIYEQYKDVYIAFKKSLRQFTD